MEKKDGPFFIFDKDNNIIEHYIYENNRIISDLLK